MHNVKKYQLYKFWDDEYKNLAYANENFNDVELSTRWLTQGWQDIGTSYYRMNTGTVLPTHGDLYLRYIDLFDLHEKPSTIRRAIVFLDDWAPGHYAEYSDQPFVNWAAGATIEWSYDTPHMAANLGLTPRYTLQITGHV